MKRKIKIPQKGKRDLTKRTKLNARQLERVKGESGQGKSSKFDPDGNLSLQLVRKLAKAKAKAKKYVLFTDQIGRRLYVADHDKIGNKLRQSNTSNEEEACITFDRKEALEFFWGFDDPEQKRSYYNFEHPFSGVEEVDYLRWKILNI
jgi:hypothetical protein